MINKSFKILLAVVLILVMINILLTIFSRYNSNSAIQKLERVEQRLDTASKAIENARNQIDTLLIRTRESGIILQQIDDEVKVINQKYQAEQKSSRQKIEKMKKQFQQDQEKLLELQKELKGLK